MITYSEHRLSSCRACDYQVDAPLITLVAASAGVGSPAGSYATEAAAKSAAEALANANSVPDTLYGHRKDLTVAGVSNTPPLYYASIRKSTGPYRWLIRGCESGFVRFHWYFMHWDSSMGPWVGANAEVIDSGVVEATWERGSRPDVWLSAPALPDVAWPVVNAALDEHKIETIYCVIPEEEIYTYYPIRVP